MSSKVVKCNDFGKLHIQCSYSLLSFRAPKTEFAISSAMSGSLTARAKVVPPTNIAITLHDLLELCLSPDREKLLPLLLTHL